MTQQTLGTLPWRDSIKQLQTAPVPKRPGMIYCDEWGSELENYYYTFAFRVERCKRELLITPKHGMHAVCGLETAVIGCVVRERKYLIGRLLLKHF